jgi:hypothetical protein
MGAQISRVSYDPRKRYSGVFQIQGGMVTDADLGEAALIAKGRADAIAGDTVHSGAPLLGGCVDVTRPALQPGIVYAMGRRGHVTASADLDPTKPLDLYAKQTDLPQPPPLPAGEAFVLYADVWEREIGPLEDPDLTDPGLHGAETAVRTRTMAQIKAAPLADLAAIQAASGAYPAHGNAVLTAGIRTQAATIDPCDPCATEVSTTVRLGNALFRLEVMDVEGPADAPARVTLAWSMENAAEQLSTAPAPPAAFGERSGSVFELFSPVTDSHKGAFPAGSRRPGQLVAELPATPPARTDGEAGAWPSVRRWDGYAIIDTTAAIPAVVEARNAAVTATAGVLKIALDTIELSLDLAGKSFLAGDHWLVTLREFAADTDRVRVASAEPSGIHHHYAVLLTVDAAGNPQVLADADRRRLSFPTLADLPADHVGFTNNCPTLYGDPNGDGARNVQAALDRLCGLDAARIAFANSCPTLYDASKTVQEALDALCRTDFSVERGYRLLFDWGVVCGLRVSIADAGKGVVRISPGSFLDRAGRLVTVPWDKATAFDLNDAASVTLPEPWDGKHEFCLALAGTADQKVTIHVIDQAKLPSVEETYEEAVVRLERATHILDWATLVDSVAVEAKPALQGILYTMGRSDALRSAVALSPAQAPAVQGFADQLLDQLKATAQPNEIAAVQAAWAKAEQDHDPATTAGAAADVTRARQFADKISAVFQPVVLQKRNVRCDAFFPPCPADPGEPPFLVPIACVTLTRDGNVIITDLCELCCRKQALTPRSRRYWQGDLAASMMAGLKPDCCGVKTTPPPPTKPPVIKLPPLGQLDPRIPIDPIGPIIDPANPVWTPRPNVDGLALKNATEVLHGNGIDDVQVVDLDQPGALTGILAQGGGLSLQDRIVSGDQIQPGDKVALLVQDGVARDYVVTERGSGKFLFPTGGEVVKPTVDLTEVDAALADAGRAKDALSAEIRALVSQRDDVVGHLGEVKGQLDQLQASQTALDASVSSSRATQLALQQDIAQLTLRRDELAGAVGGLKTDYAGLLTQQAQIADALKGAHTELDSIVKTRDQVLTDMRNAQPVSIAVGNNPAAINALAAEGITTVGDFANAQPDKVNAILTHAQVTPTDSAQIRTNVGRLLVRRGG